MSCIVLTNRYADMTSSSDTLWGFVGAWSGWQNSKQTVDYLLCAEILPKWPDMALIISNGHNIVHIGFGALVGEFTWYYTKS